MFDLRYHVASLAAVFLALIIGILVGVGISGKGFVSDSERKVLNAQIGDLRAARDSANRRANDLAKSQRAAQTFVTDAYPALMAGRLTGRRIAVVFAGPVDGRMRSQIERALVDAGDDPPVRVRALKLPIDLPSLRRALARRPGLTALATQRRVGELGKRLGADFVAGGDSPPWRLLTPQLVEEQSGNDASPADGVVIVRTVPAQSGVTARLLAGFYAGLASAGPPAVGVEASRTSDSAIDAFARQDLSTVDSLDTEPGRLALAVLLAGGSPGNYGTKKSAHDGLLPTIPATAAGE
jgi:hypothetical protein